MREGIVESNGRSFIPPQASWTRRWAVVGKKKKKKKKREGKKERGKTSEGDDAREKKERSG